MAARGGTAGVGGEWDLLFGDEPTAQAKAQALAQALKGQQADAYALQALTGGPRAAPQIAQGIGQAAQTEQAGLGQAAQARAGMDIQRQHLAQQGEQLRNALAQHAASLAETQRQHSETVRHNKAMEGATSLRGVRFNPNTGQFENVAPLAGPTPAPSPAPAAPDAPPGPAAPPQAPPNPLVGKILDKRNKEFGSDLDPNGGRSGEFGANMKRFNAANRFLALAQTPDGKAADLNPQQMAEATQSLVSLISSGGQGAQAQIEHMLPKSFTRDAAGIQQYLTSEPHGAGQQAFVQNMIDTAKREQDVAAGAIDKAAAQRTGKHQAFIREAPDMAKKTADLYGFDLDPGTLRLTPKGAKAAGGTVTVKTPEEARALPKGTKFKTPDGREFTR